MRPPFSYSKLLSSTALSPSDRPSGLTINCTVAGTANLKLAGGSVLPVMLDVGTSMIYDIHVVAVEAGGSATADVYAMFVGG